MSSTVIKPSEHSNTARKAALSSFLGCVLEYYDFFVYGSAAALVFDELFFPSHDGAAGTVLALGTFGVAYIVRPLGAVVFGHFGDRLGRRSTLIATLLLMGLSSAAIGLLPTYATAGVAAPVLLVVLRVLQGLSAGAEAAGATTLTMEYAPQRRRALFSSFTMSGFAAGMVIATVVFIPVAALPQDALVAWGWRIPFLLSVVVVGLTYVIRRRIEESPIFADEAKRSARAEQVPLVAVVRTQWRELLRVVGCAVSGTFQSLFALFGLAYATSDSIGLPRPAMLWVSVIANAVAILAIPAWAALSDRIGRRPVWVFGALGSTVLSALYLWTISIGNMFLVFVIGIVFAGIVFSATNAVWPAFYAEMFDARVRYTGVGVGSQIGYLIAGFTPSIGFAIMGTGQMAWVPVALLGAGCGVVATVSALTARETYRTPTVELGRRVPPARAAERSPAQLG